MAPIALDHVEKVYSGGVKALDDLKLEVKEGEFVVLVGPSGCGKSTALRSIAGLEEITGGTISIGGRVVNDLPPKDRDIAMVFQNYALYQHMTVADNLAFGLKLRRTPAPAPAGVRCPASAACSTRGATRYCTTRSGTTASSGTRATPISARSRCSAASGELLRPQSRARRQRPGRPGPATGRDKVAATAALVMARTSTKVPAASAVTARAGLRSSWWPCRSTTVLLVAVCCPDRGLMLVAFMITTPPVAG